MSVTLRVRSEKVQNEKSPNFLNIRPEFAPKNAPKFPGLLVLKRRLQKIHQKSLPFFNAKSPGNFKNEHSQFLKVTSCPHGPLLSISHMSLHSLFQSSLSVGIVGRLCSAPYPRTVLGRQHCVNTSSPEGWEHSTVALKFLRKILKIGETMLVSGAPKRVLVQGKN